MGTFLHKPIYYSLPSGHKTFYKRSINVSAKRFVNVFSWFHMQHAETFCKNVL